MKVIFIYNLVGHHHTLGFWTHLDLKKTNFDQLLLKLLNVYDHDLVLEKLKKKGTVQMYNCFLKHLQEKHK